MKDYLCKCNKCNSVLIDKNPQFGAVEYTLIGNEKDMVLLVDFDGDIYYGCPKCETDDYLIDL